MLRRYDEVAMQNFEKVFEDGHFGNRGIGEAAEAGEYVETAAHEEEALEETLSFDADAFEEQENPVGHESDEIVNTEVEYTLPEQMNSLEVVDPPRLDTQEPNVFNNPFKAAQTLDFDPFAVNVNYDVVADPEEADPYDNGPGF